MEKTYLKTIKLPDAPGVYRFKQRGDILYIGKATSLRDRVRSYFSADLIKTRGMRLVDMIALADTIEYTETASVLEAVLLESHLIKTHRPKYNIKDKDDKSYYVVVITDEEFPRVLMVRKRELDVKLEVYKPKYQFGPFPHAGELREVLHLLHKLFPFFDTKHPIATLSERDKKRLLFNIQIGLYPNIFGGDTAKKEYQQTIRRIVMLFSGKLQAVRADLSKAMKEHAARRDFEQAEKTKRTLFALDHIKDVSLIKQDRPSEADHRIESYDISHFGGKGTVGVMVVFEDGEPNKNEYRLFNIVEAAKGDDIGALNEMIRRRLTHTDWPMPQLIVIDGGATHRAHIEATLATYNITTIPVVSVVKDDKHKAKDVLGDPAIVLRYRHSIVRSNEEAHRFAIGRQRRRRSKDLGIK